MRPSLLLLLLLALPAAAAAPSSRYAAMGDEVVARVREHFYDPARASAWAQQHAGYAREAKDADTFARLTQAALAELHTSHTAFYAKDSVEAAGLRAIFGRALRLRRAQLEGIGVDVAALPGGHFVRHVFAGSPAQAAGLLRGDRLLEADGRPFHPTRAFAGKAGRPVRLTMQRQEGAAPFPLSVTPRRMEPKREWLAAQAQGSTVVQRGGRRVAYQHLFSCAGEEHRALLQEALEERFADADALVLDFRDGWGGCNPDFVNLFNPLLPTLRSTDRQGKVHTWTPGWKKPLVLLVNGNSRSGKELVAHALRTHRAATLVGEHTPGAAMAGRPFVLADGSLLYLAVQDVQVDGVRLEGRGVPVDVEVPAALPYAAGKDPQRERALDVAAERAAAAAPR
jgi:carboxyl-terminal processing protease